MTFNQAYFEEL